MAHLNMQTLVVGKEYTAIELAEIWGYKDHHAIIKGIVTEKGNSNVALFVTKEKQVGATPYEDRIEGNILYMMGQTKHGTDKRLANNLVSHEDEFFLFFREKHHTPFIYYGNCSLISATINTSSPSEFEFLISNNSDQYDNTEEIIDFLVNNDSSNSELILEGAQRISKHIRYERSPKNRKEAIRIHGHKCMICGFDFDDIYGKELADSFIEIHHIKQISEGQQIVDPAKDLIPVCANCHRMLHRRKKENISIDALKELKNVKRIKEMMKEI